MCSEEKYIFKLMSKLLERHSKSVASLALKLILRWAESHIKGLNASTAFTAKLWDEVRVKLWDRATKAQASHIPIQASEMQFTTFDGDSEFEDNDNPFDSRPVDTEKKPNLYPPNPHNNWHWLQFKITFPTAAFVDAICAVGSRVEKAFRSKTFNLCEKCKSTTYCLNQ
ncbi:hypothetical protein Nmel_002959 [Mimus melanotis]